MGATDMWLTRFFKSLPFFCLNPMGLNFKEEESIINISEVSKKARHLWLWEVEKLITTISGLRRDRRLFSWGINNLAFILHKPVCSFRDGTALPEHARSASCLDQRRLCHSVRDLLDGEKRGKQFQGWWQWYKIKMEISLINCLFWGCETGKEKQPLFQVSQDWLATYAGNMDYWTKCSWAGQNNMTKTTTRYTYKAFKQIQLCALNESHRDSDPAIGHRDTYLYIHWVKWTTHTHTTLPHKIKHMLKHPQEWCQSLHSFFL